MQLRAGLSGAVLAATALMPSTSRGDGEVSVRGAYYKERATRVTQPMVDATFDVGESGTLDGHFLLDAITSASAAAGAVGDAFDEQRIEVGGNYLHRIDKLGFGVGARLSEEPDYTSQFVNVRGLAELAQKNTMLGGTFAYGNDNISNASSQSAEMSPFSADLTTMLASVSFAQLLSPVLVASATYDFVYLDGYQANPYRLVAAGGTLIPERVPDKRYRNAIYGSLRTFVPATRSTVLTGYRYYIDDWGIVGHTPEVRLIQEIVPRLEIHARYRFYRQSAAEFYKDVYDSSDEMVEPFLTRDEKLGDMTTHTMGLKLDLGWSALGVPGNTGRIRTELLFEYLVQNTSFGNAVNIQFAVAIPFDY